MAILCFCYPALPYAQEQTQEPAATTESAQSPIFSLKPRAASAVLMKQGQALIHLWGLEEVENLPPAFKLKARTALENAISGRIVKCEARDKDTKMIYAQCENSNGLDLGLYMIQEGYAIVDRSVIYETIYEDIYVGAEAKAQDKGVGIWASTDNASAQGSNGQSNHMLLTSLGIVLFLSVLIAFGFLSVFIMRGFQKVINAQNDNIAMMSRERKIRNKEREVVASMLDSELKTNKAKIEAYVVVYEANLNDLKDTTKTPRYQKLGDIVQTQPSLNRNVFDKNTDKLDILGKKLASDLIHFYARIKTNPDYNNIEPDMDLRMVIAMVEEALDNARHLNNLADSLIEAFEEGNFEMEEKFEQPVIRTASELED